jgi:ankyrin repeat protein
MRSVHIQNIGIVNALLAAGADINARTNERDFTALRFAKHFKNQELIDLLISKGARD